MMKKFFRVILLIINLLFAVALLLSTLAGVVAPHRIVYISILSYGYFALLVCNVLFIVIWLCLSRWEFLVSVAAIAIRFSFVPLFFQVGGTQEVEPDQDCIKVMSFNTHAFGGQDIESNGVGDTGALEFLRILDDETPDVFVLQEFWGGRKLHLRDSFEIRGYKHYYGVHGLKGISPLMVFSKYPFSQVNDMDKKSKFYVDLTKDGHDVRICCVHLDSYRLDSGDLKNFEKLSHAQLDDSSHQFLYKFKETNLRHEEEWKEDLLPLIEKTRTSFIIAGDFNDTPASYIYQRATKVLVDPYVEQGRGFGTTYHGPYPAFRIDYILHSPDMKALSYKRVKTNISDHYPIVVTLQFDQTEDDDD